MKEISNLLGVIDRLLAPDGCPWDREQTLHSMRSSLIEEAYEVIEAIDIGTDREMEEEIGDLLFVVLFLCRLAEKEGRFTLEDAVCHIHAKLVRRHPHVFGEANVKNSEEVLVQWDKIKEGEKKEKARPSALDGIPKDLPALARAQKMAKKLLKLGFVPEAQQVCSNEEIAGESLWSSILSIMEQGVEPEQSLRKRLSQIEQEFRKWERMKEV